MFAIEFFPFKIPYFDTASTLFWNTLFELLYQILYQTDFSRFFVHFWVVLKTKNPHPKSAENPCKIKKIGRFIIFRFLVWVTRLELAASTTPTGFCTKGFDHFRLFSRKIVPYLLFLTHFWWFSCPPKNVLWCIIVPTMHWYYALIYYAIGKLEGFDTFMLTLKRSFVKCIFEFWYLTFDSAEVSTSKPSTRIFRRRWLQQAGNDRTLQDTIRAFSTV